MTAAPVGEFVLDGGTPFDDYNVVDGGDADTTEAVLDGGTP